MKCTFECKVKFHYLSVFSPVKVALLLRGHVGHVTIPYLAPYSGHQGSILLAYPGTTCSVCRDWWECRSWCTASTWTAPAQRPKGLDSPVPEQYDQTALAFIEQMITGVYIFAHGCLQELLGFAYFWLSFVTISEVEMNRTRLRSITKCSIRNVTQFTSVFLIRMKSFIQVRLTFNISGFLSLRPLGNELCVFLVIALLPLVRLTTHPELLILGWLSTAEWTRGLPSSGDAGATLQLLFSGEDCGYWFGFKWTREKHLSSVVTLLLYVAPRLFLN